MPVFEIHREECHDCEVLEGELHHYGCDMERCPFCGNQLLTCNCKYKILGFEYNQESLNNGLPESVYKHGLDQDMDKIWKEHLANKGRIPYIEYPNICSKCGTLWPRMFNVPNSEWEKYIPPAMRHTIICRFCYDHIKECIDTHSGVSNESKNSCRE